MLLMLRFYFELKACSKYSDTLLFYICELRKQKSLVPSYISINPSKELFSAQILSIIALLFSNDPNLFILVLLIETFSIDELVRKS